MAQPHLQGAGQLAASSTGRNYLLLSLFAVLLADEVFHIGLAFFPGLSFKNLYLYMIVFYLMVSAVARGQVLTARFPGFVLLLVGLCVYGMLSWGVSLTLHSYYNGLSHLQSLKTQLLDPALFFGVFFFGCRTSDDAVWLAKRISLAIGVSSVIVLVDFLQILSLGLTTYTYDGRFGEGGVGGTNQYAAFLDFFVLSMSAMFFSRNRSLIIMIGALASMMLILQTGSRGALVGMFGSFVTMTFVLRRHLDVRTVVKIGSAGLVALLAIAVVAFLANPEMFISRLNETQGATSVDRASAGRTATWVAAMNSMLEQPFTLITGVGWDMFRYARIYTDPHNYYLLLLYNIGAIGVGLFIGLFASIVRTVIRALDTADAATRVYLIAFLYGLASLLFCILFGVLYTPWPFIWSYIGLMTKIAWLALERPAEATPASP